MRVTDPKAAQCGEVLKGVLKPAQCKLFGQRVHAGASYRRADGVIGRIMRSLLQLRTPQSGNGDRPSVGGVKSVSRPRLARTPYA